MSRQTIVRVLESLAVALVVSGVLFGFAQAWGQEQGVAALWTAAAIAFLATAIGCFVAGILRERGERPAGAPSAGQVGLRLGLMLVAFACVPVAVLHKGPLDAFALWMVLHLLAQLGLQLVWALRAPTVGGVPSAR